MKGILEVCLWCFSFDMSGDRERVEEGVFMKGIINILLNLERSNL